VNTSAYLIVLASGKEPVTTIKPPKTKVKDEYVSSDVVGKRVVSIYRGSEGLDFYSKPTFDNRYRASRLKYGRFPTIVMKLKVEGAHMYEVKNSRGHNTVAEKFVKVEGASTNPKSKPAAKPKNNDPRAIGEIKIVKIVQIETGLKISVRFEKGERSR
jgi:hypothetical protein